MSKVVISFEMTASGALRLTEDEMWALDALVGYGDDAFISAFKEKLGAAYIGDHVFGLRSFFAAVRRDVLPALHLVKEARRDLQDANRKRLEAAKVATDQANADRKLLKDGEIDYEPAGAAILTSVNIAKAIRAIGDTQAEGGER